MSRNTDVRILRAALWAARHRSRVSTPPTLETLLSRAFYRRGYPLHYRVGGQGQQAFPSISEVRNSGKQQGHMRWITIGGADEGDERHVGGSHVLIDGNGTIVDGPAALKGRSLGGASSGGGSSGGHQPPDRHPPKMPEDRPAVADTVGDRNAAAGQHFDRLPEPLREVTKNLHGTRQNRKTGSVQTDQVDAGVAKGMADYLRQHLGRDDGFGKAVDLGADGLGYVSPAGAVTVRQPAQRGEPWTVGYEADPARVEQLAQAESSREGAKPRKEKKAPRPAKTFDDDFDTRSFGDDGAATPAPRKATGGRLGEAIRQTAAEHGLEPGDLADAVDFVWEEKRKASEEREAAKGAARKKTGLSAGDVSRLANAGHDYASVKAGGVTGAKLRHFDAHAQELAREFPELGLGDPDNPREDFADRLWQVLGEGKQKLPARTDPETLREAAELARSAAYAGYGDQEFAEPFQRQGRVARFARWRAGRRLAEHFNKSFASRWGKLRYAKEFDESKHPRGDDGEFTLKNDAPKKKPPPIENEPTKQKRMFDGMDALPGQMDLFSEPEAAEKAPAKSKAPLKIDPRELAAVTRAAEEMRISVSDLPSVVGAPDDATVFAGFDEKKGLKVAIDHPKFACIRWFRKDENGNRYIHNGSIHVSEQYQRQGIGSSVFSRQVQHAAQAGFSYITAIAARDGGYNGYITWPKLGYDQAIDTIEPATARLVRKTFPKAKSVLDVMATQEGKDWWERHGCELSNAVFDLSRGSRSMTVLNDYLAGRRARYGDA